MENMDERFEKMERQLRRWEATLDELTAGAHQPGAIPIRAELVDDLRAKHAAACAKVAELRAADAGQWDGLKAGADLVWDELEDAFAGLRA